MEDTELTNIPALKFVRTRQVKCPVRAHATDAGVDFFVPEGCGRRLFPGETCLIPGGVKVDVPEGYALVFFNKSGVAANRSLVLGSCVVDCGYQGELMYNLHNIGTEAQDIAAGEKIVQGLLLRIATPEPSEVETETELYGSTSERGAGGFGSTGAV